MQTWFCNSWKRFLLLFKKIIMVVILSSVKMESIIKIIQTCHAKFMKPDGEDTDDMRQNFPLAWVFSFIHRHLLQTFYHSVGALMKRQLKDLRLLLASFSSGRNPSVSDKFPRKLTEFLILEQSLFLYLQVIIPLPFLSLDWTKLLLFSGFLV